MPDPTTPTSPETDSPEPSLSDFINESIESAEMNEFGELEIVPKASKPEDDESSDGDSDDSSDTSDSQEYDAQAGDDDDGDDAPASSVDWNTGIGKRYRDLQSYTDKQLTSMAAVVQELEVKLARYEGAQGSSNDEDDDSTSTEEDTDLSNYEGGAAIQARIDAGIKRGVEQALGGLNVEKVKEALADRELLFELDEFKQSNPDWEQYQVPLKRYLDANPDKSFQEAYDDVVELFPATPSPPSEPAKKPTPTTEQSVDEVQQRRLEKQRRMQRPVPANTETQHTDRPASVNSIREAFESAAEEAFQGGQ